MKNSAVPYMLTAIVALASLYGFYTIWTRHHYEAPLAGYGSAPVAGVAAADGPPLDEFSLTERSGRTFHSREMQGQVWVVSFFFSSCPGSCLRLNQALQSVHDDPKLRDVRLLSITCDPEVDTPEVLAAYADRFGADPERWLFCTSNLPYIQRIGKDMLKLAVERQTHSDRAAVVDRQGKLRGWFLMTNPLQVAMLKKVLAQCLEEPQPAPQPEGDAPEQDTAGAPEPASPLAEQAATP